MGVVEFILSEALKSAPSQYKTSYPIADLAILVYRLNLENNLGLKET